ncbi:hypothetical protein I307_03161 [Cryptococcus deuterogattii 99/473]|uniref:Unplaced genomic scaffold supercont1.6, whole genome shotgun sequence n=1 Tax=Cryptococcus deuterogattii Ram5 TaxID=1296110 RepID=A0A0D0TYX9_9TREE|nr:hypothetical protein I309_04858 [Cryptococcus deuterogattii LA55]KIR32990.1 hypothetical protein I352_04355 [Cryptococcus deuterogattii MMRL2647]KIR41133.1 hypothetical protein I313_03085 [Cryptococcus deuterogattii Ram5]KIR72488.1 hypothetical protein I310_03896 [Cryptococcus deuterogattii CA1014]KIR92082.1 hypothetical protein I304_04250 [Cryptococcus deuterogattii CBS 10090]KIR97893.1 hypothetical protein L804_05041 [Cryptococcus deuterogattii 2001/935-1]KIY57243.1 hypothetical protein 
MPSIWPYACQWLRGACTLLESQGIPLKPTLPPFHPLVHPFPIGVFADSEIC